MKKLFLVVVLCAAFFGVALHAQTAPHLYFRAQATSLSPGSEFEVAVLIESAVPVNAIDVAITYPVDVLQFLGVDDRLSLVDIWEEMPRAGMSGAIVLRGGMFTPFSGTAGELLRLHFGARAEGAAKLSFRTAEVLLADGKGTKLVAQTTPLTIALRADAPLITLSYPADNTPPLLEVKLTRDPVAHMDLITFVSRDPESGIQATSLRAKTWFSWSNWNEVMNPVAAPSGAWEVQIRTVNNAGETAVQTFYPASGIALHLLIMAFLALAAFKIILFYNKRIRRT